MNVHFDIVYFLFSISIFSLITGLSINNGEKCIPLSHNVVKYGVPISLFWTLISCVDRNIEFSSRWAESVHITPLEGTNLEGVQGGGASVVVNVSGNVLTSDFVEGELADNIREAVRRGTDFGIG